LGWDALGIDQSQLFVDFATLGMKPHNGVPEPRYVKANVLEFDIPNMDVALVLSVAMYLFDEAEKGWAFFRRVSERAEMMFIDFGGMYANRLPFKETDVLDEMLSRTAFLQGILLGRTALDRPFFLFRK